MYDHLEGWRKLEEAPKVQGLLRLPNQIHNQLYSLGSNAVWSCFGMKLIERRMEFLSICYYLFWISLKICENTFRSNLSSCMRATLFWSLILWSYLNCNYWVIEEHTRVGHLNMTTSNLNGHFAGGLRLGYEDHVDVKWVFKIAKMR